MLQILKWTIFLLISFLLVTLSIVNKQQIYINTFPLDFELSIPLYALIFSVLVVGILLGGIAMSSSVYYWKRNAKVEQKRANELEREIVVQRIDKEMQKQLPLNSKY